MTTIARFALASVATLAMGFLPWPVLAQTPAASAPPVQTPAAQASPAPPPQAPAAPAPQASPAPAPQAPAAAQPVPPAPAPHAPPAAQVPTAPAPHERPAAGQDPDNEQFALLVEAESRYRGIAANGGWPMLADGEPMKPGEPVDCARLGDLEKRLEAEGYRPRPFVAPADEATGTRQERPGAAATEQAEDAGSGAAAGANGCAYRLEIAGAVQDFQHDRYLVTDGIVGGQTRRQLARPVEDVLAKIDYALKRWRANAANMTGAYIVVNIPAFELAVYEGRREVMRMPVIVGQPDWPTPEMSDKIEHLVLNPAWNIPKSIAAKEVLPRRRKDPGYFRREGIVADGDGTLTQKPGPRNPLGRLKFMMPNSEDIYLHDTPHGKKFEAPARAFSHGCVRVQKPLDLAAFLLKDDPQWPRERIQAAIDSNETQTVRLANPLPVHLLYIPAVASGDGRLRVAPDIYDRIGNTEDERVLAPAPTEEDEFLGAWP